MCDRYDPWVGTRMLKFIDKINRIIDTERNKEVGTAMTYVEIIGCLEVIQSDLINDMCEGESDV